MCLILPNHCFLFRNFVMIIMFILNFMHLCFMQRISSLRKCSFPVRVKMVSMLCLSLLPAIPQAYWSLCVPTTVDLRHRQLSHPTSCILNFLVFKNKIVGTSRRSLAQCQACSLGKSSHLSLRPTSHKTTAPLDLIFSDVWGLAPMFSSDGFCYFIIFIDAYTKHIWYYLLVVKSDVFSTFHYFQTLVKR